MSKKALMKIRNLLMDVETDIFNEGAIRKCIAICDQELWPSDFPPHQGHSDTSRAAAAAIAPKFGPMQMSVLELFARNPSGLIDEEGQWMLGMDGNSYRPCRVTLEQKGFVKDTEGRRKTRRKRPAVIWAITERGVLFLKNEG